MPGGGLRILPNKSWHVWKYDNIEKVRKDERLAAEADEKKRKAEVGSPTIFSLACLSCLIIARLVVVRCAAGSV